MMHPHQGVNCRGIQVDAKLRSNVKHIFAAPGGAVESCDMLGASFANGKILGNDIL